MAHPTRQMVGSAFFEAFFVVLGVALALAANEWRQARADQVHARRALAAITAELHANRTAVQASHDYHEDRVRTIFGAEPGAPALQPRDFPKGFVMPAQIFQTAWDAAAQTGALTDLDYPTVLALSRVYESQDRYESQSRAVGQLIYEQIFREGLGSVAAAGVNLGAIISTFLFREVQLLAEYDQVLAFLEEES